MHLFDRARPGGRQREGRERLFRLSEVSVYLDHPAHALTDHTLNIDFLNPARGPSARVAVELTADTARALARAIDTALDTAPPGLV
ncbi:MAG: DUF6295 family protein [Streptosporangiaceae bacterium]